MSVQTPSVIGVETHLDADHPTVLLSNKLEKLIADERATAATATSALLSLVVIVGAGTDRASAALALRGLHYAAQQIAAQHFPEWQSAAPSSTH